ncbi:MAG TPA: hypothetical protein VK791_00775, partial [bacterium]|nr:hypothetical protein [bacterium]
MFQWFNEPKINFMAPRRLFLSLSALACLAGVYAIVLLYQGKANLGTDFGAGVQLRMSASSNVEIDQIRQSLKDQGYADAQIQQVKEDNNTGFKLI